MSDKDIISQLGLPDSLNKRLEELLKMEKVKEKSGEGTFNESFTDLKKAREQFRKAYKKLRQHTPPSRRKENEKDFFATDDEQESSSGLSGSDFSDISATSHTDLDKIIEKLPSKFMTEEQRQKYKDQEEKSKFLDAEFEKKKLDLNKTIEALAMDQEEDSKMLKAMATELAKEDDSDFTAGNEELDRVMSEIKSQCKSFRQTKPSRVAKIDKTKELK